MFVLYDYNEFDANDTGSDEPIGKFRSMEELEAFERTLPRKIRTVTIE